MSATHTPPQLRLRLTFTTHIAHPSAEARSTRWCTAPRCGMTQLLARAALAGDFPLSGGLVVVADCDAACTYRGMRTWDANALRFDAHGLLDGVVGKYVTWCSTLPESHELLRRVVAGELPLVDAASNVPWSREEAEELLAQLVAPPPAAAFDAAQALTCPCPFSRWVDHDHGGLAMT